MDPSLPPTVAERIAALPRPQSPLPVPLPPLAPAMGRARVFLGIESFRRHMSNEGWQLQAGLAAAGYQLWGARLPYDSVDVPRILSGTNPKVVILQDKREWDPKNPACINKREAFRGYEVLGRHHDCLKLTVLKDAQHNVQDSALTARRLGLHGWITYYHPDMVAHLTGYVRKDCLLRTYHGLDPERVPPFAERGGKCLLSGAASPDIYPLRWKLFRANLPDITSLPHPGYHASGTHTDDFLQRMSQYRVAICTASVFGYALRKIIEATACGCVVITDLPPDEVLPEIDANLVRIHPDTSPEEVNVLAHWLALSWNAERQAYYAELAKRFYDYKALTLRLAQDIHNFHNRLHEEHL